MLNEVLIHQGCGTLRYPLQPHGAGAGGGENPISPRLEVRSGVAKHWSHQQCDLRDGGTLLL